MSSYLLKNKYPFIDGLRTIAILMVFYEHLHYYLLLDYFKPFQNQSVSQFYFYCLNNLHVDLSHCFMWFDDLISRPSTGQGTMGVDLFFLISGFLITRILVSDCGGGIDIGRFYLHRFFKIFPSYFCLIMVTFAYLFFVSKYPLTYLLKELSWYLLFFQNYQGQNIESLTHTWSLVVEEQFYFCYPIIAFFVFKSFSSVMRRRQFLMLIMGFVLIVAPMLRYYFNYSNNTAMATLYHFDALALGCLVALNEESLSLIRHFKNLGIFFWVLGVGLYFFLTFIFKWKEGWTDWYVYNLSELAALSVFLAGYLGVSSLSSLKLFQWIGRHSYGIYLWHLLILIIFFPFRGKISPILFMCMYIPVVILVGVISSFSIEKYFLNLRKKLILE